MKIKFNLAWILAIAVAVIMAAMGFMSFYYRTGGGLVWPIVVAVCLLALPIVTVAYLEKYKGCSKPFFFRPAAIKEISLLGALLLLCVASMALVNHFFTVNGRTKQIETVVADQRKQLIEMKQDYARHVDGRVKNYDDWLRLVISAKEHDNVRFNEVFGSNTNPSEDDISVKKEFLRGRITLEGLSDSVSGVFNQEQYHWWMLPRVMNNVEEITSVLKNSHDLMVQRSHNDTVNMNTADYWEYSYTQADDIMSFFTKSDGFISNIWTVLSILLAYLCIMLPYLMTDRDSRHKGLFIELKKKDEYEEEVSDDQIGIGSL